MQRGDIWWANLPDPVGSCPGYRRPVLVIQTDSLAPGNMLLPASVSSLPLDSVINVSQLMTIDKLLLIEYVSSLPA